MTAVLEFLRLSLLERRRRILGLIAFGLVFLAAGATAGLLARDEHGHVEMEALFALGGTTLVSALLLLGWLVGRFPMIAALVLTAGIFSDDRAHGMARLFAVRPRSLVALYAARFLLYMLLAFVLSVLIMPLFDILVLGEWPEPGVFALIAAQVIVFATLTALFSVFTRADAWVALFLGMLGIVWDSLRRAEFLVHTAPAVREAVSVLLPPQGAMLRIEQAFGMMRPVPWDALLYIVLYGALVLLVAGVALARREL
jgi:hypothetical protein